MIGLVVGAACAIAFVPFALWWRQGFLRDRPIELWGTEFSGPRAVAERAASAIALAPDPLGAGNDWVMDLVLSPVWFFWGDLRTRRPARQLRRWRLNGERDGRRARVQFDDDHVVLELDTTIAALWATAGISFAEQEGLRPLLPMGSERWVGGTQQLAALFALGVTKVVSGDGTVHANVDLVVAPERWATIFDGLVALSKLL